MMQSGKQEVTPNDQSINNNASSSIPRIQQPREAYLLLQPEDILTNEIGRNLADQDIYYLSRVSKRLHTIFKDKASNYIREFLEHVVNGKKEEVQAALDKHPYLLLHKKIVTDQAGRKIYGTAYQIALGAKDVSPFPDKFQEMAEMIASFFEQIPNGEAERIKQYNEQFPEGFEEIEKKRRETDRAALNTMLRTVKNTMNVNRAQEIVKDFLDKLKERTIPKDVIETGYHFNDKLYTDAIAIFYKVLCEGGFKDPTGEKRTYILIRVIGGIQCYFTANLAQALCTGMSHMHKNQLPLSRTAHISLEYNPWGDQISPFESAPFFSKTHRSMAVVVFGANKKPYFSQVKSPSDIENMCNIKGYKHHTLLKNMSLLLHKLPSSPQQNQNSEEQKSQFSFLPAAK